VKDNEGALVSIVDDDESIREATSRLIKANGFRTESYSSAREFLESASLTKIGCLVLDLRMQGMSGLELQRLLVTEKRHVPIVFISAHGDPKARDEAMGLGAIDFLSKPFSEEALLNAIRHALFPRKKRP
jgi:FixJ family two-component response regulator